MADEGSLLDALLRNVAVAAAHKCFILRTYQKTSCKPCRMNTYKTKDLKYSGMNTYKKAGRWRGEREAPGKGRSRGKEVEPKSPALQATVSGAAVAKGSFGGKEVGVGGAALTLLTLFVLRKTSSFSFSIHYALFRMNAGGWGGASMLARSRAVQWASWRAEKVPQSVAARRVAAEAVPGLGRSAASSFSGGSVLSTSFFSSQPRRAICTP